MSTLQSDEWDSRLGYLGARFGSGQGGIPKGKPLWRMTLPSESLELDMICVGSDSMYCLDESNTCYRINIEEGKVDWAVECGAVELADLLINKDYVVALPKVLDRASGEIVCDLEEMTGELLDESGKMLLDGSILMRGCEIGEKPSVMKFDLVGKNLEKLELGCSLDSPAGEAGLVYLWCGDELIKYDYRLREERWRVGGLVKEEDRMMLEFGDSIIVETQGYLSSLKEIDGNASINWVKSFGEISSLLDGAVAPALGMTGDMAYIARYGKCIVAIDNKNAKIIWEVILENNPGKLKGIQNFCIVGDLLVCVLNKYLIVLDRFDGSEVWSGEKDFKAYSTQAHMNKIIFSSLGGDILCYKWTEPYSSPVKPK